MDYETKKVFLVNLTVFSIGAAAIFFAIKFLLSYFFPFVIGVILAAAVKRPARRLSGKTPLSTGSWSVIFVALIYLLCGILLFFIIKLLISGTNGISAMIPNLINTAEKIIDTIGKKFGSFSTGLPPRIGEAVEKGFKEAISGLISKLTELITDSAAAAAGILPSFVFSAVITIVASCYTALDYEHLIRFLRELLSRETYNRLLKIRNIFTENIFKYIMGYAILSLLAFIELLIGFLIMRIKYPLFIAAITAFIDLLPIFGTGTVLIPWAAAAFISGNSARGTGLLILYCIIFIVRYFAEPKIVGKKVGIDPLISLLAMVTGLKLGGITGLLLFPVGCVAVIQYYRRQIAEEHENKSES